MSKFDDLETEETLAEAAARWAQTAKDQCYAAAMRQLDAEIAAEFAEAYAGLARIAERG